MAVFQTVVRVHVCVCVCLFAREKQKLQEKNSGRILFSLKPPSRVEEKAWQDVLLQQGRRSNDNDNDDDDDDNGDDDDDDDEEEDSGTNLSDGGNIRDAYAACRAKVQWLEAQAALVRQEQDRHQRELAEMREQLDSERRVRQQCTNTLLGLLAALSERRWTAPPPPSPSPSPPPTAVAATALPRVRVTGVRG